MGVQTFSWITTYNPLLERPTILFLQFRAVIDIDAADRLLSVSDN